MKKNYFVILLAALVLLPFANLKAQFHSGDSLVIQYIMNNNFDSSNLLNWSDSNPANWLGVVWNSASPQRIVQLDLKGDGSDNAGNTHSTLPHIKDYPGISGSGVDSRLSGTIDFSGLTALYAIDLRDQDSIAGVNILGLNNLQLIINFYLLLF